MGFTEEGYSELSPAGSIEPTGQRSRREGSACAKAWKVVYKAALNRLFIVKTRKAPHKDVSVSRRQPADLRAPSCPQGEECQKPESSPCLA